MADHYTILGVTRTATTPEIDAAWRRAVKLWHPDRNRSAEASARLQEINAARMVLVDDVARRRYDRKYGINRTGTPAERMKRPVKTTESAEQAEAAASRSAGQRPTSGERERVQQEAESGHEAGTEHEAPKWSNEWWARYADAVKKRAQEIENAAIRAAAEQDRSESTLITDRRPHFTRYVLMPIGITAIIVAAMITLILV